MKEWLLELVDSKHSVRVKISGSEFTIGSGAACHLSLPDATLPPQALKLVKTPKGIQAQPFVKGVVKVDGKTLSRIQTLKNGSVISLGNTTWRVVSATDNEESYTRKLSDNNANKNGEPLLEIPAQEGRKRSFVRINSTPFTIGSSDECDLVLKTPYVSRFHARIVKETNNFWIEDLGSTNGTFVNEVRIERAELSVGDKLRIGDVILTFKRTTLSTDDLGFIVGASSVIKQLKERIRLLAPLSAPVLITGETGSGKELVARALHTLSGRSGEFIAVNCAAIPENLLEAQLFGYVRGGFTGAVSDSKGAIGEAEGGTLLLDEIGELPLHLQSKLLRTVETNDITPVGASKPKRIDVRFLFATNRNLAEEASKGRFRQDLFYRISAIVIKVPPLRERKEDIPLLAEHFLREFGVKATLSENAIEKLKKHHWWGNVRELRNVLLRTVVERQQAVAHQKINAEDIMFVELPKLDNQNNASVNIPLEERERQAIVDALTYFGGNKTQAARALGISRSTLYEKMRRYGIGG